MVPLAIASACRRALTSVGGFGRCERQPSDRVRPAIIPTQRLVRGSAYPEGGKETYLRIGQVPGNHVAVSCVTVRSHGSYQAARPDTETICPSMRHACRDWGSRMSATRGTIGNGESLISATTDLAVCGSAPGMARSGSTATSKGQSPLPSISTESCRGSQAWKGPCPTMRHWGPKGLPKVAQSRPSSRVELE